MEPAPSAFPDPRSARDDGLVAVTPDMSPQMLLDAYSHGLFPWSENPVRWFSPDPRAIFLPDRLRMPSRFHRIMRKGRFRVSYDTAFERVITSCREAHQHEGEWIGESFVRRYTALHEMGHAHSTEVWQDEALVGGLYGVQVAGLFAGESMFHTVSNASKVAFVFTVHMLAEVGTVLFDAQVLNEHTCSLGAVPVRRDDYLMLLDRALAAPVKHDGTKWPASLRPA